MKVKSKILFFFAIILASFSAALITHGQSTDSFDAISIRIMPNPKHYSSLRWYKEQKFAGAPQQVFIDGYSGIRDGNTLYVNTAYIRGTGVPSLFTNIFVITYNLNADKQTNDIFGQILAFWKFNTDMIVPGDCMSNVYSSTTPTCLISKECGNGQFCGSQKSAVMRDISRLEDLTDLQGVIDDYRRTHNNKCPVIDQGSYVPQHVVSTWPSWKGTLSAAFGLPLPIDPVNQLGKCATDQELPASAGAVANTSCGGTTGSAVYSCSGGDWSYNFNIPATAEYTVFAESSNNNAGVGGIDLSVTTLPQSAGSCAPGTGWTHKIEVSVDGSIKGYICNFATLPTSPHQLGKLSVGMITAGPHSVKFKWVNDSTYTISPGVYHDSNITIYKVGVTSANFESDTCWDSKNKKFAKPIQPAELGTPPYSMELPENSMAYTYVVDKKGDNCAFMTASESCLICYDDGHCEFDTSGVCGSLAAGRLPGGTMASTDGPLISCLPQNASAGQAFDGLVNIKSRTLFGLVAPTFSAPAGFTGGRITQTSVGSNIYRLHFDAVPTTKNPYNVTINSSDSAGNSSSGFCKINVSGNCGDGVVERPQEECEVPVAGNWGVGVANTPVESFIGKQYECQRARVGTETLTPSQCKFKGGFCGDGVLQNGANGTNPHGESCDFNGYTRPTPIDSRINSTYRCGQIADGPDACKHIQGITGGYCGDGIVQTAYEECDQGSENTDIGACRMDCQWTKKSIASINLSSTADGMFNADSVIYNNDNTTTNLTLVAGGQNLKLGGIQPTAYAYIASANDAKIVKVKVSNNTSKRDCGATGCYWNDAINEGDLNTYVSPIKDVSTEGTYPSRTAVNLDTGDVWVHFKGRPQKIARYDDDMNLLQGPCVIDSNEIGSGQGGGGIAIDKNGNVWAGNNFTGAVVLFKTENNFGSVPACTKLAQTNAGYGVYGLTINADGNLFFRGSMDPDGINGRIDVPALTVSTFTGGSSYGVTVDKTGQPWFGDPAGGIKTIAKNAVNGSALTLYGPAVSDYAVSIDAGGNIWGASPVSNGIHKFDTSGNLLLSLFPGIAHHGISGTSDGYIISPRYNADNAKILDFVIPGATAATTASFNKTYAIDSFYSYADMAGLNRGMQFRSGSYTKLVDSGYFKQHWGTFSATITNLVPGDVVVYIGASDSNTDADLNASLIDRTTWDTVTSYKDPIRMGRYLFIKIVLKSGTPGQSPVVSNFGVN